MQIISRCALYTIATVFVSLVPVAPSAQAQDTNASGASAQEEIEMIVVTARRREEAAIEVPASIDVFGAEQIERQGILDFEDLGFRSANVAIFENSNNPGRTQVTIRGVPGRAGVYVDDVFVGDSSGINTLLVDIERIEIVRGPQTTLFGRDALSGAINTVTNKPGDEFEATVLARYGDYNLVQGGASISGPISDRVSAKLAAGYRERETYDEVRGFGDSFNALEESLIQGQISFDVTDRFSILANVDVLDNNGTASLSDIVRDYPQGSPAAQAASVYAVGLNDGDPYDRVVPGKNVLTSYDRQNLGSYIRAEWDVNDNIDIRSITAYREHELRYDRDGDAVPFDILSGSQPLDYEQFTQELTVFFDNGSNLSTMFGLFYFDSESTSVDHNNIGDDIILAVLDPGTLAFLDSLTEEDLTSLLAPMASGGVPGAITLGRNRASPFLQANVTGLPGVIPNGYQTTFSTGEQESIAAYGQGSWTPTDQWEVTVGLRFTREKNRASVGFESAGVPALLAVGAPTLTIGPFNSDETTDDIWSPSLSVRYTFSSSVNTYFTAGRGFRSGGFNTAPPAPNDTSFGDERRFDPEILTSYEFGLKTSFDRARLNAAVFWQDYEDFQRSFSRIDDSGNRITTTENTTASILGFEVDATFDVTDNFQITATYGYQDSEYDDFPTLINTVELGAVPVDLSGQTLPFVPARTANLTATYFVNVSDNWQLRLGIDGQYRSKYQVTDGGESLTRADTGETISSDPEIFVDDTTIYNASAALISDSSGWAITARGYDLGDEHYRTGLDFNVFAGVVSHSLSAPRTWTVEVSKRF